MSDQIQSRWPADDNNQRCDKYIQHSYILWAMEVATIASRLATLLLDLRAKAKGVGLVISTY